MNRDSTADGIITNKTTLMGLVTIKSETVGTTYTRLSSLGAKSQRESYGKCLKNSKQLLSECIYTLESAVSMLIRLRVLAIATSTTRRNTVLGCLLELSTVYLFGRTTSRRPNNKTVSFQSTPKFPAKQVQIQTHYRRQLTSTDRAVSPYQPRAHAGPTNAHPPNPTHSQWLPISLPVGLSFDRRRRATRQVECSLYLRRCVREILPIALFLISEN